ncbi:glutamate racemase [Pseudoalteromonas fenneropenaei]|uniref:Glutamate racemase n=1 Tax=Pseudoalteromonas fenneropenaei TaxID=1737459 RepID=A0ABV7CQH5_9GAMM
MLPHILVFDSGIGGTSVLSHIQQAVPNAHYSYVMDNALLPYGLQSQATIIRRLTGLLAADMPWGQTIDMIVIACNTASTQALAALRELTQIPVVGVVPAIKPAAQLSQQRHIALLATPATISNSYTKNLIRDFAADCQVDLHHSTELVSIAERFYWLQQDVSEAVTEELAKIDIAKTVDVVVLGCTHFPIIAKQISSNLSAQCVMLDSGAAIARRVSHLLSARFAEQMQREAGSLNFYATKEVVGSAMKVNFITLPV